MSDKPPHLLIFEPDPRGHAEEWLNHFTTTLAKDRRDFDVTFLIPNALARRLDRSDRVRMAILGAFERSACTDSRLVVSAVARWRAMRRHLRRTGATHGFFMSLDHLSLPLGLGLAMGDRKVSGILFRPSVHYPGIGSGSATAGEWVRDRRKDFLYRRMLDNAAVHTVFSLDPYFPDFARARYRNGTKVVAVPDPVFPIADPSDWREAGGVDASRRRTVFTLFGALSRRKGLMQVLEAAALLPFDIARRTEIAIAGAIDSGLRPAVARALAAARRRQPALLIDVVDRRLEVSELASLMGRSDVILAPYQRFVGSSGTILWAARFGCPVISQDTGLLGRLTKDHGLGLAVDTTSPAAIAEAIAVVVERGLDAIGDRRRIDAFAQSRTPAIFVRTILDRVLRNEPATRERNADDTEKSQGGTACSQEIAAEP